MFGILSPSKISNTKREQFSFYALLLFVVSLPFSEALVSVSSGLLFLVMLLLSTWKHPSVLVTKDRSVYLIGSVFMVYMIGLLFTVDFSFGLYELKKVFFWVILPLPLFLFPRLTIEKFWKLLLVFCFSILISTFFWVFKFSFREYFQITDIRDISFVSHIRYSFQIVLAIIILVYVWVKKPSFYRNKFQFPLLAVIAWLSVFLFLQKSIVGLMTFYGTVFSMVFLYKKLFAKRSFYYISLILVLFVFLFSSGYAIKVIYDFYNSEPIQQADLNKKTIDGNSYVFDLENKARENGNWVYAYLCEDELREAWNERSSLKYDDINSNGYTTSSTLIRYLTSRGLRKDAMGVATLSENDIKNIQGGMANYIYENRFLSIYPRIYETVWEVDRYFRTGDPNFQSVSQRLEFTKASFVLIKKNPLLGIGTGNWKIKYAETYKQMASKLIPENYGPSHNQYLNYIVKFGFLGFCWILLVLIYPFVKGKNYRNELFVLFLVSMFVSNFGDANWETHMGLPFFLFFYCLFLWHSGDAISTTHTD